MPATQEVQFREELSSVNPGQRTGLLIFEADSPQTLSDARAEIHTAAINFGASRGLQGCGVASTEPPYPINADGTAIGSDAVEGKGSFRYRQDVRIAGM